MLAMVTKLTNKIKYLCKFFTDRKYRSVVLMKYLQNNRVQQTTQFTMEDRYPEVFAASRAYFDEKGKKDIKILSYGCCTGEEVVTLRRYFPEAFIVGAEINRESLKTCRQRDTDDKIVFVESKPKNIAKYGPYDAVFCMAVLERTPHMVMEKKITDLSNIYPFEKFQKQIEEIDSYVKAEGLLITHYAHYNLLDTCIASDYVQYGDCGFYGLIFGKDSKLKKPYGFEKSMYVKHTCISQK